VLRALGLVAMLGVLSVPAYPAGADAPESSLRPAARPAAVLAAAPAATPAATPADAAQPTQAVLRPRPRPAGLVTAQTAADPVGLQTAQPQPSALALATTPTLRPKARPQGLAPLSLASAPMPDTLPDATPEPQQTRKKKEKPSKKGSVCGDPAIKGEALAPIKGKVKGCGLDKPVRVTSISGIRLNQPATFSCDTALAMKSWIENGLRPAMGRREVVEIRVAASYICRNRNNKKGAKISEHGRGRAVDVAGFVFADGTEWSISRNYNKQVRRAHKAACGIFGTTLGPGSDGYHEDHLHFDIARHNNGPYCR